MNRPVSSDERVVRRGPYPELTWPALIVGWLLGSIICISIGYAALILGFSIEGSELAAILGWGVLRGILGRTSIVENNINQTVASAVNGASAGMMFSVPAILILARQSPEIYGEAAAFSRWLLVLSCIAGGMLGLAFVIPLRKQMIEFNRLAYPGGIAVATILKSPGAGLHKALLLIGGAIVSGVTYALLMLFVGEDPKGPLGAWLGLPSFLNVTFLLSLMTVGVGFLSGRGGLVFGYGGFICYFVLAPLLAHFGSHEVRAMIDPAAAAELAGQPLTPQAQQELSAAAPNRLRVELFRPTGIGMLIGAALGGIVAAFPLIRSAIRSMQQAAGRRANGAAAAEELPIRLLYLAVAAGVIALMLIAWFSVPHMPAWRAGLMALLGTLWIWIAGVIISECVGRTNWSPLSGMTLIAVTILLVITAGMSKPAMLVASVMVGAAVCCAISQAGDMMLDLKSGYLIGAYPRRQQIGQYCGMALGPLLVIWLMFVLDSAHGIGSQRLPAPQATALASVITAIVDGNVPAWRYLAGAGLGAMLALSGLGGVGVMIGLGFYMPFDTVLTYTVGAFARIAVEKLRGRDFAENVGIPIAAGLIVGEALVGVGNAFYQIYRGVSS